MKLVTKMNFLIVLTVIIFYVETVIAESSRSIIKLTHPMSIHSPFHNPNSTKIDVINASKARLIFLQNKIGNLTQPDEYRVPVFPTSANQVFIANAKIGTPPVPQYLIMDTGSSFTWTQCKGCEPCKDHKGPLFDPTLSRTHVPISCRSPQCSSVPGHGCDEKGHCTYATRYADGTRSSGDVVTETVTFNDMSKASGVVIGCGMKNRASEKMEKDSSGILGLGPRDISISSHLGSKFSYCVGDLFDPVPEHHFLLIGNDAIMRGGPSPLIIGRGYYYVSLMGISVGLVKLPINPEVFKLKADNTGGTIIDSGSAITYLVAPAYEALKAAVARRINNDLPRVILEDSPTMLCYKGLVKRDVRFFPSVTLEFEGGQTLIASSYAPYVQVNARAFCLAYDVSSERFPMNLVGVFTQQFYNVGYNVRDQTIHFARTPSCKQLAKESNL